MPTHCHRPMTEPRAIAQRPSGSYAAAKWLRDRTLFTFDSPVIVRPFMVYGPGQAVTKLTVR